jgi:ketosteroid isomerase-like protein
MTGHPNATIIRRGYAAFSAADLDTLKEVIHPDAVQHMPANNRFSGDHRGVESILAMYGQLAAETHGTLRVELEEVYANEDTVATVYHLSGDRGGEHLETRDALLFTMRDGRAVDILDIASEPEALDKFWV